MLTEVSLLRNILLQIPGPPWSREEDCPKESLQEFPGLPLAPGSAQLDTTRGSAFPCAGFLA